MRHETFYSELLGLEVGYSIYLPWGYEAGGERYPVEYHLHGWMGDERSDVQAMEKIYGGRRAIMVFPNNSPSMGGRDNLPVEEMVIRELIPHIDGKFPTVASREGRAISGFSMGGGMAFAWAVKYHELFSAVTAYAGTYHHYYHPDYGTVGEPAEKAEAIYRAMASEGKHEAGRYQKDNIIALVSRNAEAIRGRLDIELRVGTEDILYCDNEIMRLHLEALGIPHRYVRVEGAAHSLADIV